MSKVITFSTTFPSTHPRKGQSTEFTEKIWASLLSLPEANKNLLICHDFYPYVSSALASGNIIPKKHTIRAGDRWKVGDWFSPRIWSGKPYSSKQIIIAGDIQIKRVVDIQIDYAENEGDRRNIIIGGKFFDVLDIDTCSENLEILAKNDGLAIFDFCDWFNISKAPFSGQILIWDDTNLPY